MYNATICNQYSFDLFSSGIALSHLKGQYNICPIEKTLEVLSLDMVFYRNYVRIILYKRNFEVLSMRKCFIFCYLLIYICFVGCQKQTASQNYDQATASVASIQTETASPSMTGKDDERTNIESIPTPNAENQYIVSNYHQFNKVIGSDREILVYPGDYTQRLDISGVSNLTITGVPANGKDYVYFQNSIQFTECSGIKMSNMAINFVTESEGSIGFKNSNDITLDHCKIFAYDDPYELFYGPGLSLYNVSNCICSDTIIQNYTSSIDLDMTENVEFVDCKMMGGHLEIGNFNDNFSCKNTVLKDCVLLREAGICSIWDNDLPVAKKSGYEIRFSTEEWSERRFLNAILYYDQRSRWFDVRYINTYTGSKDIYEDGRIIKLAEHLKSIDTFKVFPSIDYIVPEDAYWNQYYAYIGEPESVKLVINIIDEDEIPDEIKFRLDYEEIYFTKILDKIMRLRDLANVITDFGLPITIAYRDGSLISATCLEFSNQSFKEFLLSGDVKKWDNYCYVFESW